MNQRRIYNAKTVTGLRAGSGTQNQQFSDLVPAFTDAYDIGSSQLRWRQIFTTLMTVYEGMNVSGIVSMEDLFLQGDLQVLGRDSLPGNLFVTGNSQLVGNTTVNGNLRIDGTLSFGSTDYADIVGNTALIGDVTDNRIENSGGPANQSSSTIITPRLHGVGAVTTPFLNVMGYALADQFATTRQTDTTSRTDTNAGVRMEGGLAVAKTVWANILRADALIQTLDLAVSQNLNIVGRLGVGAAGSVSPARSLVVNDSLASAHISEIVNTSTTGSGSTTYKNNSSKTLDIGVGGTAHANLTIRDKPYISASENVVVPNGLVANTMLQANCIVNNGGHTSTVSPVSTFKLTRDGVFDSSYANVVDFLVGRYDQTRYTGKTQLDINLWHDASTLNVMTMRSNGFVGIGRTAPTSALDVNGTIKCTSLESSSGLQIQTLTVNQTQSATISTMPIRMARSNGAGDSHIASIGMGTEGTAFSKAGIGFERKDTWDRGNFVIFNNNTASATDFNWNTDRRFTITRQGYCGLQSLPPDPTNIVPDRPFQIVTDFNGLQPMLLRNVSLGGASSAGIQLTHDGPGTSQTLNVQANSNLGRSVISSSGGPVHLVSTTGTTEVISDSANVRIESKGPDSGGGGATGCVTIKGTNTIFHEANSHNFRSSSGSDWVAINNGSIAFAGSTFRLGTFGGNLAILNGDGSFNRAL